MICPECNFDEMEDIVDGVLYCPNCKQLLKEKDISDDATRILQGAQGRVHPRPQRRVGDNWDEFHNKTLIYEEGTFNENLIDSSLDQENIDESSETNFSDSNNIPQPGSGELINNGRESDQKGKNFSFDQMNENFEDVSTFTIKITNFKQKVTEYLKKLIELIKGTAEQKDLLRVKSKEILNDLVERAEYSEMDIPKDANLKVIGGAILYATIQSEKDIPRLVNVKEIIAKLDIKQGNVYDYYHNHLKHLYPRVKKQAKTDHEIKRLKNRKYTKHFFAGMKGFKRIRRILSLHFFDMLKKNDVKTNKFAVSFKYDIINNINLPLQLTRNDIIILQKLSKHPDFDEYFSDLTMIIKYFILSAKMHKKIGADLIISYIADVLIKNGIVLFQTQNGFPITLIDIYDYLKENYDEFFPERSSIKYTTLEKNERWREDNVSAYIIGSRIKIYVINHIYGGRYIDNGMVKCPKCEENEFCINTNFLRLQALQFNHILNNKIHSYTTKTFYNLFTQSIGNPFFLKNLISQIEAEKVELICTNHHNLLHSKYNKEFLHLINNKGLFSLTPILIHLLVRISVNSFYKTKSLEFKKRVRQSIIMDLKRKYIIDRLNCGVCPICNEFNTTEHLPSFQGHHLVESKKTNETSYFFKLGLSCQEIVDVLKGETVGFICGNCHTVIQNYQNSDILFRIYNNSDIVSDILNDYESALDKFIIVDNKDLIIKTPLKKEYPIFDRNIEYLFSLEAIIDSESEANNGSIASYLNISEDAVRSAMRNEVYSSFLAVFQSNKKGQKRYQLTEYGKKALKIMHYFKNYYSA